MSAYCTLHWSKCVTKLDVDYKSFFLHCRLAFEGYLSPSERKISFSTSCKGGNVCVALSHNVSYMEATNIPSHSRIISILQDYSSLFSIFNMLLQYYLHFSSIVFRFGGRRVSCVRGSERDKGNPPRTPKSISNQRRVLKLKKYK